MALLGLFSDSTIYGNGSDETRQLLQAAHSLPATYFFLKLLATYFSCVSGIPAGLFAPSLAVGAGFGADVSIMASATPAATFVLLGIGAYFAGVFQAPLTAVVIVTEMAGSYSLVLPLMLVALVATATSCLICRRSYYSTMSERWLERLSAQRVVLVVDNTTDRVLLERTIGSGGTNGADSQMSIVSVERGAVNETDAAFTALIRAALGEGNHSSC